MTISTLKNCQSEFNFTNMREKAKWRNSILGTLLSSLSYYYIEFPPPIGRWGTILSRLGGPQILPCPCWVAGNQIERRRGGGGGVKIFHTSFLGGQQGFLYWVDGGSPSLTGQKLIYPSSIRKSPPNRFIQKVLFPPPKVHPPPLNNNFHVITQYKFEF